MESTDKLNKVFKTMKISDEDQNKEIISLAGILEIDLEIFAEEDS